MLYSEENVRANIRNRDGKRVFYLGAEDTLTPSARDLLTQEKIQLLPANMASPSEYTLANGAVFRKKPEHYTHLRGDVLVPKTHPVIAFRGAMDTLQAELLLCQQLCQEPLRSQLGEILTLARNILRWDVMQEPAQVDTLCGLTLQQQRSHSHMPQKYYSQPHFMPEYSDGPVLLQLNRARCAARSAELAAAHAFVQADGVCQRTDLLQVLNRLSSMLYILMIRQKAGKYTPLSH